MFYAKHSFCYLTGNCNFFHEIFDNFNFYLIILVLYFLYLNFIKFLDFDIFNIVLLYIHVLLLRKPTCVTNKFDKKF